MTIEDRLRRAIDDRTSSVEVDEQVGLERITGRLAASADGDLTPDNLPGRAPLLVAAAAAVLVALFAGGFLLLGSGGDGQVDIADQGRRTTGAPPTTHPSPDGTTDPDGPGDTADTGDAPDTTSDGSSEEPPASASEPPSGTPSPPETDEPLHQPVVWPRPSSDVRFDDPVSAARSFALYYARFDDPVIGEFRAADSRSGDVVVQPREDGPETLVRVAVSPGGQWFVTGSGTADITVDEPVPAGTLSCPLATSGTALAFEGTVQVRIDAYQSDGDRVEVGRGFVTGSGVPPAGPFSKQINCTPPSGVEDVGVVAYWTDDAAGRVDGPLQIVTVPVRLP